MSDDRPSRYIETADDGTETVVYRASSLGGCLRAMVAAATGIKGQAHQQWFQDVLDEGTRMESHIAEMWAEETMVPDEASQPECELEIGVVNGRRVIVRGHMDGISMVHDDESRRVREYKKFRPSTWPAFVTNGVEVNKCYPWQVSVYMHATGLDCDFVGGEYVPAGYDPATGVNTLEHIESVYGHLYTTPPIPLIAIKQRIAKVERLVSEGYGPDEVECSGGYPCAYWFLHDVAEKKVELEKDAWWTDHLAQWDFLKQEIADAKLHVEKLDGNKKSLSAAMTERMVAQGVDVAEGGSCRVGDVTVTRVRSTVKESTITRKAYELDYVKITAGKAKKP